MLRTIAEWKYIITTDLRDAFYQIRLLKESMKWCATQTPFRGLRVYLVASQGLPGSSEWLEELLALLFGEMVRDGWVGKVADDLFVGGDTVDQLLLNWSLVLKILFKNGLNLKAIKTFIAPTQAQILGWDWQNGALSACSHKLLPLVKCDPPEISDLQLSEQQAQLRAANQEASAKHKARGNPSAREADVIVGSLVYIKSDGDKNQGRDRYLVVEVGDEFCTVQKFVKSQLRRKKYQLKLTEVYPVQPENIEFFGTIRGFEEDECTERDDPENHEEHSIPTSSADREEREVPANVQAESDSADLSIVEEDVETVPNDIQSEPVEPATEVEPRRRSKRQTSRPAWMDSGDYVLDG